VRIAIVSDITASSTTDAVIPQDALDFLDEQTDASLIPGGSHPSNADLILRERWPRPIGNSQCRIALVYRLFIPLKPPPGNPSVQSGGVALEQVESWVDRGGNVVKVFGPIDEFEQRQSQDATFTVLHPRAELHFEKALQSHYPGLITIQMAGVTNSATWNNAEPGRWLCTEAMFETLNAFTPIPWWRFSFSFRHQENGWNPIVAYMDNKTDRPASGRPLPDPTVEWYPQQDFNVLDLV